MSKLSTFQVNAVKSMSRDMNSLQRKLDKINEKEQEVLNKNKEEKAELEAGINKINEAIILYTGGLTVQEVLNPVAAPLTDVVNTENIDESARPEETDVTETLRQEFMGGDITQQSPVTVEEVPEDLKDIEATEEV